jgi:hypothetical protein
MNLIRKLFRLVKALDPGPRCSPCGRTPDQGAVLADRALHGVDCCQEIIMRERERTKTARSLRDRRFPFGPER